MLFQLLSLPGGNRRGAFEGPSEALLGAPLSAQGYRQCLACLQRIYGADRPFNDMAR